MKLNVEVERVTRHRIVVQVSVPDVFTADQVRTRAEICAADIPDSIEWKRVSRQYFSVI